VNDRELAVWSVAVGRWLRSHPVVEAGPSVRASQALAELAGTRLRLAADTGVEVAFETAALVALSHRIRVRPGADADALVRQAVREALQWALAPAPPENGPGGGATGDDPPEEQMEMALAVESGGHRPAMSDEEQRLRAEFGDEEAARFLDQLLDLGPALPPAAGPSPPGSGRRGDRKSVV